MSPDVEVPPEPKVSSPLRSKWGVVGLLWFCGFFNYADRQAVFSVFPLLQREFALTQEELGYIGSSFMIVYALAAPLAGYAVDRLSRRRMIVAGLWFWSLICAGTALSRRFWHLLAFRAAEGLGEAFYFPASMSYLADRHGPATRSRAMSVHQTSVYVGTVTGSVLAGWVAEFYGWRLPFWFLGLVGMAYAPLLLFLLVEPLRGAADGAKPAPAVELEESGGWASLGRNLGQILRRPPAVVLLLAFVCANFVAAALLTWLPMFVYTRFSTGLGRAALIGTLSLQTGSLIGVLVGGTLADRAARRMGGRMRVQALGLILGAPCVLLVGRAGSVNVLVLALLVLGLCKGIYDANIFASVYDVIPPGVRGTAAGLMNTVGWTGGSLAPWLLGHFGDQYGLGPVLAGTAFVYLGAAALAFTAGALAARRASIPGGGLA